MNNIRNTKTFRVILSILVALIIWLYVENIDPSIIPLQVRDIPVEFIGEDDILEERGLMVSSLNQMGLACADPLGAFYVFPSIRSTGLSSDEFCQRLLEEQKVAVVPGGAFGQSGEGHVRISYSYSVDHLIEALGRIEAFVKGLKR